MSTVSLVETALALFCLAAPASTDRRAQPKVLFDFDHGLRLNLLMNDCRIALSPHKSLRIETGHNQRWPGVTFKAPAGKWDLSGYRYVALDVNNVGTTPLTVLTRIDNPGADGRKNCVTGRITLDAKKRRTLTVELFPSQWRLSEPLELIGMRGYPVSRARLDAANVTQLLIFVADPQVDYVFEIDNIRAAGAVQSVDSKTFFPFIDEFGQFVHGDWPGKTHSLKELVQSAEIEQRDLTANPGPPQRTEYGGWAAGPKLKATGSFRVEKFNDKWWLVDPTGRLFWSHGIDCVRAENYTPITDREHYFKDLPKSNSPLAAFYGFGQWAPHGYYKDHAPYKTYDFSGANLLRKYGTSWRTRFAEITHRRLKSWGINTIANWSDSTIYLMRKTPYVCTISYSSKRLEGSKGYWGKFYDVFDPSFRQQLRNRLAREKDTSAADPWCIGYFVHNELSWGDDLSLAVATLASPPDQPAKNVFIQDLKARYKTIDKLNAAWGSTYADWQALQAATAAPDKNKARDDLAAFYTKTAETYFKTIREELKKIAPEKLYLGCRFAWVNDRAARAAAKYCDVVSYNRYTYSVAELRLPGEIDMPIIIGEFHFGALDRGMFHTGLRKATDQADRAEKYTSYVLGALKNPYIVGTHWFQYKDQPTTGRGDGENYQIGFIDICDRPYPEIIQACRQVGRDMYRYRLGK